MRGVARQEDPSAGPLAGNAGMEVIDHLAADRGSRIGPVRGEQFADAGRIQQIGVLFARMQLKLEPPGAVRPRQGDARTPGVAEHLGVSDGIAVVLEIHDQPPFVEGGAAEFDAEAIAHGTARAVACDEEAAGDRALSAAAAAKLNPNCRRIVLEAGKLPAKQGLHLRKLGQVIAKLLFEDRLPEGIAPRVAERRSRRLYLRKAASPGRVVV